MAIVMKNAAIRVRFAPSPTGHLHIGGLRTALFNWLFARKHGGTFLVRIEDTDTERSSEVFTKAIFDALDWVAIGSDETVLFQTQRLAIYQQMLEKLLQEGKAYRCFCPGNDERLESDYFKYDGKCRIKNPTQEELTHKYVIRIKFPMEQKNIDFNDSVRGTISFPAQEFDDFIIARSDGMPIYNFVVVVDDALMNISHVIRGEDHISNTPKQIILYQALGFVPPQFAHIPLILGPGGERLSKRHAATSVLAYRQMGYLPEALCNYLIRLGWSHGDQELFTRQEMIDLFSLEAIGKKGSMFDIAKLDWVNGHYIRQKESKELLAYILQYLEPTLLDSISGWNNEQLLSLIDVYKSRVKTLRELVDELIALYKGDLQITQEDQQMWLTQETRDHIKQLIPLLQNLEPFTSDTLSTIIKQFCKDYNLKMVTLAQPIRLALTGKTTSPGIFELLSFLGKQESLKRLKKLFE